MGVRVQHRVQRHVAVLAAQDARLRVQPAQQRLHGLQLARALAVLALLEQQVRLVQQNLGIVDTSAQGTPKTTESMIFKSSDLRTD